MKTRSYSLLHRAFADVASDLELAAMDVRVLVALRDLGGRAYTDRLQADMFLRDGSSLRRSMMALRSGGLITGRGTPGVRACLEMSTAGTAVIDLFDERVQKLNQEAQVGTQ